MNIKKIAHKNQETPTQGLDFKLFIAGGKPESGRAVARLQGMLKEYNLQTSSVQIVDIEQNPQLAKEAQVIGVPTLVKEHPFPRKSIIGDLSNSTVVLRALGLPITKKLYAASVAENEACAPPEFACFRSAPDQKAAQKRAAPRPGCVPLDSAPH